MANVLILGATSAVASEVCSLWAARGHRLFLVGRSAEKMQRLVERLGNAVAGHRLAGFDDGAANERLVLEVVSAFGPIDLALIAHGDLGDQLRSESDVREAERIIFANFTSVVSLLVPLANHMEARGSGHLMVISSVAGERGRPRNFTYGAAKRAVTTYLQGLRSRLHGKGVAVTTIKLGPVDSPMTVGHPKNALFATTTRAARDIVRAADRKAAESYVPSYWAPIMMIVRNVPERLFQKVGALSGR